jgi:hypothetical protein
MNENTDTPTESTAESTTECATQSDTEQGSYSTVKTSYARACIVLLALNFVLTGYCFLNIAKYQGEQLDQLGKGVTAGATAASKPTETSTEGENKFSTTKED